MCGFKSTGLAEPIEKRNVHELAKLEIKMAGVGKILEKHKDGLAKSMWPQIYT